MSRRKPMAEELLRRKADPSLCAYEDGQSAEKLARAAGMDLAFPA